MVEENLERAEKPAESVEAPSKEEKAEAPSKEKKPTLEEKIYTKEEFGKAQSSWDKQISLAKAEAKKAEVEAAKFKAEQESLSAEIQELQTEYDKLAEQQFADDPEAKRAFRDRKAIADERRKLIREKAEVEQRRHEAEKLAWSVRMAQKANEVMRETGIAIGELESCQTEEEMEVKGLRFQLSQKGEAQEEKPPKIDSGISSGGGGMPESAKDKMRAGWGEIHKT